MAAKLPPQRVTWPRDIVIIIAAALALVGLLPLAGHGAWAVPAVIACAAAAAGRGLLGYRAVQRGAQADRLAEALTPLLGLREPDRRTVRLTKWTQGWPGEPRMIILRYAPGITDDDPAWRAEVVVTTGRRMLSCYQISRHDRRRLQIHLVRADGDQQQVPALQARAERTLKELLGANATLNSTEWNGEELTAVDVRHEAGVKLASAAYRTRIERVVSTMLPGRWRAKWNLLEDTVRFELRPPLPNKVDHPTPVLDPENLYRIPIAISEDGETIYWNLRGTAPHAMVVGKTGTGKTVVINGAVMEFCYRGWPVRICDPKRIEFMGLRGWPNVEIVATVVEDQVATIFHTYQEMERRYELIERGEATEDDFEPMLLVLDEYRDFVAIATAWYASVKITGMPNKCPAFEWVASLARKGRSARIHVLLGTQRPDAEFLSGEMRDNFATRISLGRLSPQGAKMMWDAAYIGVAVPLGKPGRGTAVDDADRPGEIQAYWTPDPRRLRAEDVEDRAILDRLHRDNQTHPQLQIELAEDLFDDLDDTGNGKSPSAAQLEKRLKQAQWSSVTEARLVPVAEPVPDPMDQVERSVAELLARGPRPGRVVPDPAPAALLEAQARWPEVHAEDAKASRLLAESPMAAALHARRALELILDRVCAHHEIEAPAGSDLVNRIDSTRDICPRRIVDQMHAVRKIGNAGAHPGHELTSTEVTAALSDLNAVLTWALDNTAPKKPTAGAADQHDPEDDLDKLDADYEPATTERPGRVQAGDLILVDEDLDQWGVVASDPEPDEGDESLISIEWRSDDDDGGWLEIPDDERLTVRHPIEQEV